MAFGAASEGQKEPKKSKPAKAHKLRKAVPPPAKKKGGSKILGFLNKNKKS